MYDLTGKTVLVTGASRGIGAASAKALADAGAKVIAHFSSFEEGAREVLKDIPEERKIFIGEDLSVPGSGRELFIKALAKVGRVDIVLNNAAVNLDTSFTGDNKIWDENWETTMRVNVFESSNLIKEAVQHFLANGGGILISMSSWSGQRGSAIAELSAYAASKAAAKAVTQTVAQNYAKQGILAYVIAPGIVKTRMADAAAIARGGEDKMKAALVLGELVPTSDVGDLVVFLATGKCRHLTGATIDINGATYVR
ncbi:MAG: SDR family NAD(P)-dependent oxidoreductase [Actinobacteria bacterium]|nr:SDR family NAD(P)-dependent oxidoreductase [Actinomycetota bacterium]